MALEWSPPEFDGGAPITTYVVEKRDVASTKGWVIASKSAVRDTSFTVPNLILGATYEFRVTAENEAGIGEASEPSEQITTKSKEGN